MELKNLQKLSRLEKLSSTEHSGQGASRKAILNLYSLSIARRMQDLQKIYSESLEQPISERSHFFRQQVCHLLSQGYPVAGIVTANQYDVRIGPTGDIIVYEKDGQAESEITAALQNQLKPLEKTLEKGNALRSHFRMGNEPGKGESLNNSVLIRLLSAWIPGSPLVLMALENFETRPDQNPLQGIMHASLRTSVQQVLKRTLRGASSARFFLPVSLLADAGLQRIEIHEYLAGRMAKRIRQIQRLSKKKKKI